MYTILLFFFLVIIYTILKLLLLAGDRYTLSSWVFVFSNRITGNVTTASPFSPLLSF